MGMVELCRYDDFTWEGVHVGTIPAIDYGSEGVWTMGLMSLFGKGPLSEKKVDKIAELAMNPYAQTDVRKRELIRLLEEGTEYAIKGALKRFSMNANGAIADEDEKKWLENALVEVGEITIEPLRDYIRVRKQLSYALRAYWRLTGPEQSVGFFIEVLESHGPDAYRALDAKLQIIWALADHLDEDPRIIEAFPPFVLDHGDDVRWAVMDLMEKVADAGALTDEVRDAYCEGFAELVMDGSVGPRIQRRAAEILCERGWPVPGDATELAKLLDEDYFMDKKRFVRRRTQAGSARS